jgi:transcription elongation factor GreA
MSDSPSVTWLTQDAYDRLQGELADREGPKREEITKRIESAREEGDLKENGGYHAAKDEQGKNEARIRQLRALLLTAQIGAPDAADGEVTQGAIVQVTVLETGLVREFLLGSREEVAHVAVDVVSPGSPIGGAIIGRQVGDVCSYTTPVGKELSVRIEGVRANTA